MALLSGCMERVPVYIIFAIFNVICFLILLYLTVKFIRNYHTTTQNTQKSMKDAPFILATLISITCLSLHLIWIPYSFLCNPQQSVLEIIRSVLGGLELYLIILSWYLRLYLSFRNSSMALSLSSRIFWYIYFFILTITYITYVSGTILLTINYINAEMLGLLTILCFMVIVIGVFALTFLFIIKLFQTYKYGKNEKFINVITKITILTISSFAVTILSSIVTQIYYNILFENVYGEFVKDLFVSFDNFTNCLFMALSFPYYEGIYEKLCNCMHLRCNLCWKECASFKERKELQLTPVDSNPSTARESKQQTFVD